MNTVEHNKSSDSLFLKLKRWYDEGKYERVLAFIRNTLPEHITPDLQTLAECAQAAIEYYGSFEATNPEKTRPLEIHSDLEFVPELYTPAEICALEQHIETYFGHCGNVFHELVSPDIHVDIYVIEPTPERNYYTLITGGMGAHFMNVPEELADADMNRAELLITLPPDWNLHSEKEEDYWPLRWLKILARMPLNGNTWLGYGHTIAAGEAKNGTLAPNNHFTGILLLDVQDTPPEASHCLMPDGDYVNIYQLIPLCKKELDYKLQHDVDMLLDKMADVNHVVDIHRPDHCAENNPPHPQAKQFRLGTDEIYPLLLNWKDPDGCVATDRITVDGCRVNYMIRQCPDEEHKNVDSGWRFFAGDESQEYLNDLNHSGVYQLNTLCNFDLDIIPLLHAPYGTAYKRDGTGKFRPTQDPPIF